MKHVDLIRHFESNGCQLLREANRRLREPRRPQNLGRSPRDPSPADATSHRALGDMPSGGSASIAAHATVAHSERLAGLRDALTSVGTDDGWRILVPKVESLPGRHWAVHRPRRRCRHRR